MKFNNFHNIILYDLKKSVQFIVTYPFPDYIDYLPKGAIVCKVKVMGDMPKKE